jgi:hypothetical protein
MGLPLYGHDPIVQIYVYICFYHLDLIGQISD